jgi:hypothetical protein
MDESAAQQSIERQGTRGTKDQRERKSRTDSTQELVRCFAHLFIVTPTGNLQFA